MKISDFSGGLSVRLDPSLLQTNEATVYENINNSKGVLTSEKNFRGLATAVDRWFYKFEDEWYSSLNDREYIEYRNKLYWTERDNYSKKVVNGVVKDLGINAPENKLTTVLNPVGSITGDAFIPPTGRSLLTSFSPSGDHVACGSDVSPYVTFYDFSGGRLTKLDDPVDTPASRVRDIAYSADGRYVALALNAAPFLLIYRRNGDEYVKVTDPATLPASVAYGASFSSDGVYLAIAHNTTPFVTVYKNTGGVFTKLANPAALPAGSGRGALFSPDNRFLIVSHDTTPFVTMYERNDDTFTKLANPATIPTSQGNAMAFTSDGMYLTIALTSTPFICTYKREDTTFTKLADPATIPHAVYGSGSIAYSNNSQYLVFPHSTAPFLSIYKRDGDILTLLADTPEDMPIGAAYAVSFGLGDLYLSVGHATSPFVTIYKRSGDVFEKFTNTDVIQYVYTYYDSSEGIESAPSPLSDELELPSGYSVDISGFAPSPNPFVDIIRLYRIGANATDFTLLLELPIATTTYNDNIKTIDAVGDILESYANQPPEIGLRYITEANGILFAAKGDIVYYSKIGQPDYWPALNTIEISADVTGIVAIPDGVVFFTKSKAHILLGTAPEEFRLTILNPEHGCINHNTIKRCSNRWLFLSVNGICELQGSGVQVVSSNKLDNVTFDAIGATVYNEQYTLTLANGAVITLDLRFGGLLFKTLSYPLKDIYNTGVFDNILYGVVDGELVRLHEGEPLLLKYMSPNLTEGDASMTKMYNNVYIKYDGQFTVSIFIDDVKVSTHELIDKGIADLKVPQEQQRGSAIRFEINGLGTVYEIEYKVVGRENGR